MVLVGCVLLLFLRLPSQFLSLGSKHLLFFHMVTYNWGCFAVPEFILVQEKKLPSALVPLLLIQDKSDMAFSEQIHK